MNVLTKTFVGELALAMLSNAAKMGGGTFDGVGSGSLAGPLSDLKVGIYTNNIVPTASLTLNDLEEPVYGDYARQDVSWNTPRVKGNGDNDVLGDEVTFQMEDGDDQTAVAGFFIVREGDDNPLKWVEKIDPAVTLIDATQAVTYLPRFTVESTTAAEGVVIS